MAKIEEDETALDAEPTGPAVAERLVDEASHDLAVSRRNHGSADASVSLEVNSARGNIFDGTPTRSTP